MNICCVLCFMLYCVLCFMLNYVLCFMPYYVLCFVLIYAMLYAMLYGVLYLFSYLHGYYLLLYISVSCLGDNPTDRQRIHCPSAHTPEQKKCTRGWYTCRTVRVRAARVVRRSVELQNSPQPSLGQSSLVRPRHTTTAAGDAVFEAHH